MNNADESDYDVAVIGGGVLGVSLYYWLTTLYDMKVALIEKEGEVAMHTTSRNTGVIHSPFYLNPKTKRTQAISARLSRGMWGDLAKKHGLEWHECGTIQIIKSDDEWSTLEKYRKWAYTNGLTDDDFELLTGDQISQLEKEVRSQGGIYSKTDVSTNYGQLTGTLIKLAGNDNSRVLSGAQVTNVSEDKSGCTLDIVTNGGKKQIRSGYVINAAGGSSIRIAHMMGYANEYSVLFFRGEYWRVEDEFGRKVTRNIYSVPRHKKYPFLDPHLIVRADGRREIGPNAVLVSGPEVYQGLSGQGTSFMGNIAARPVTPKLKLLINREFLSLVASEWRSSLYKSAMAERIRYFIPNLTGDLLTRRGVSGVRSSLIGRSGFVPEAVILYGDRSMHILNYNSPGATGGPAYSAYLVNLLVGKGILKQPEYRGNDISENWNFDRISSSMMELSKPVG